MVNASGLGPRYYTRVLRKKVVTFFANGHERAFNIECCNIVNIAIYCKSLPTAKKGVSPSLAGLAGDAGSGGGIVAFGASSTGWTTVSIAERGR